MKTDHHFTMRIGLFVCLQSFALLILSVNAEMGCVREQANAVVEGVAPDDQTTVDAPHMCLANCILAKALPCTVAVFTRKSEGEKGVCELYKAEPDQSNIVARQYAWSGGMASVFHLLAKCPDVNRTQAAAVVGRRVAVVEGRSGYGAPVQVPSNGWGPWSEWSACATTESCGRLWSVQNRIRICSVCGSNRAIEVESRACNCAPAPILPPSPPPIVVAQWYQWGPWSACSVSCGTGTIVRHRECTQFGMCPGVSDEFSQCSRDLCAAWSPWDPWSKCSATCGSGSRERVRQCSGGGQCTGPARESEPCGNLPPCCTQWSPWGPCSATCGDGTQTRTRECGVQADPYNAELVETRPCSSKPCAYWLPWSEWAPCSSSCGPGSTTRRRECQGGVPGVDCPGEGEETQECVSDPCPEWSPWGEWTPCSVTCGTGEQTRTRECLNGGGCVGESFESKPCHLCNCPVWSEWNPYDDCNMATGTQDRVRYCCGGCDCSPTACPGTNRETIQCGAVIMPSGGQPPMEPPPMPPLTGSQPISGYGLKKSAISGAWEEWSSCSVSCGNGVQHRKQICDAGAANCRPKVETKKCQRAPCDGYDDKKFHSFYRSRLRDRLSRT